MNIHRSNALECIWAAIKSRDDGRFEHMRYYMREALKSLNKTHDPRLIRAWFIANNKLRGLKT